MSYLSSGSSEELGRRPWGREPPAERFRRFRAPPPHRSDGNSTLNRSQFSSAGRLRSHVTVPDSFLQRGSNLPTPPWWRPRSTPGTLYVFNLADDITSGQLFELFCTFGYIKRARIHRSNAGKKLGSGRVVFQRFQDAQYALLARQGACCLGRRLQIAMTPPFRDWNLQIPTDIWKLKGRDSPEEDDVTHYLSRHRREVRPESAFLGGVRRASLPDDVTRFAPRQSNTKKARIERSLSTSGQDDVTGNVPIGQAIELERGEGTRNNCLCDDVIEHISRYTPGVAKADHSESSHHTSPRRGRAPLQDKASRGGVQHSKSSSTPTTGGSPRRLVVLRRKPDSVSEDRSHRVNSDTNSATRSGYRPAVVASAASSRSIISSRSPTSSPSSSDSSDEKRPWRGSERTKNLPASRKENIPPEAKSSYSSRRNAEQCRIRRR